MSGPYRTEKDTAIGLWQLLGPGIGIRAEDDEEAALRVVYMLNAAWQAGRESVGPLDLGGPVAWYCACTCHDDVAFQNHQPTAPWMDFTAATHDGQCFKSPACEPVPSYATPRPRLCTCGNRLIWWCATCDVDRESVGQGAESLESQVKRLANFIMREMPGEPSRSEGAIDTAIRLLRAAQPHAPVQKFGRCPGCERLIGLSCAVCGPAAQVQQGEREAIAEALNQAVRDHGDIASGDVQAMHILDVRDRITGGDFAPATQRAAYGLDGMPSPFAQWLMGPGAADLGADCDTLTRLATAYDKAQRAEPGLLEEIQECNRAGWDIEFDTDLRIWATYQDHKGHDHKVLQYEGPPDGLVKFLRAARGRG